MTPCFVTYTSIYSWVLDWFTPHVQYSRCGRYSSPQTPPELTLLRFLRKDYVMLSTFLLHGSKLKSLSPHDADIYEENLEFVIKIYHKYNGILGYYKYWVGLVVTIKDFVVEMGLTTIFKTRKYYFVRSRFLHSRIRFIIKQQRIYFSRRICFECLASVLLFLTTVVDIAIKL